MLRQSHFGTIIQHMRIIAVSTLKAFWEDSPEYTDAMDPTLAWYRHALENPSVQVTFAEETADYIAVPVEGAEHDRVDADNPLGLGFRILTGFPPRYFVRLDPV